jgi:ABC-type polysaccharide/polyol phosphate export permease
MTDPAGGTVPLREYSDVTYVFEPNDKSRPPFRQYVNDLWERRRFMIAMAEAELRGPRSTMLLGELWAVIDPIFQAAIYYFLINLIRGGAEGGVSGQQRLALMVGCIFLFNFSSTVVQDGGRSILKAKGLMLNSTFPRALLPLSSLYKALIELLPAVCIYILFHLLLRMPAGPGLFLLPLVFLIQVTVSLGLALIFATLTVFFRDTTNILSYLMRIFFFATPIIYPVGTVPEGLRPIATVLNPFFGLFSAYQEIILGNVPTVAQLLPATVWAIGSIIIGYRIFVSHERNFALHL